jgi:antitoxin PrlF
MAVATLTSKGQLTLPIELRNKMNLHAGSKVEFVEVGDGEWRIQAQSGQITSLKGILDYKGPTVSLNEMDVAIALGAAQDFKNGSL